MKKSILILLTVFSVASAVHGQNYGWTDISANIPQTGQDPPRMPDVYFVSDNEGWITCVNYAEIYHTTDGGETFEVQTTQYHCNAIHMLNENEGYAGGSSGFIYKTIDGGDNWDFYGTTASTLTDISFPPMGDTGYCCGINGNIHSIDSSGVTKMTSGVPDSFAAISFPINSQEGWVCGGSILRHFINGNWTAADQDYPSGGYNAIYMVNSINGWIVGDGGIIAHTEDGKNWFEQTNPDSQTRTLFDVFFLNANEGFAVGSGGIILHTTDGGINWTIEGAGLTTESLAGVHFTSPTNGYVVGTGKTLLKYAELSGTSNVIVETLQFEIFPNPAKNKIQIQCSEFKTENGIIELLSLEGKKILEKEIESGIENIELDLNNLKSGMYLCKISTDKKSSTKKLIIE
ncbi:MAG: YCF48-related protein [Candidatus Tenebribacter mawsonii]|nr:YCF48-related protein [Candidatus Tenebribacter mawsonii]